MNFFPGTYKNRIINIPGTYNNKINTVSYTYKDKINTIPGLYNNKINNIAGTQNNIINTISGIYEKFHSLFKAQVQINHLFEQSVKLFKILFFQSKYYLNKTSNTHCTTDGSL